MFLRFLFRPQTKKFTHHEWISTQPPVWDSKKTSVTWIGHATFLIHIGGVTILTDPIFFDINPLCKRISAPGLSFDQMPKIDIIALSHNHWDHFHAPTLKLIVQRDAPRILAARGDKRHLAKLGFSQVQDYMWWERETINGIECTFLPSYHWSQRSLCDRNKSLWGSWMFSVPATNTHIYFAGDTAYSEHFSTIAHEFPSITAALMPIGPCEPKEWMRLSHVTAEEAVQGFKDLNARHFIPMHWGTYYFGIDDVIDPINRLKKFWNSSAFDFDKEEKLLHIVKLGEQKIF